MIFIKSFTGIYLTVEIDFSETIEELKKNIESKTDIKFENIMLLYAGKQLMNENKINDYMTLRDNCTVYLRDTSR